MAHELARIAARLFNAPLLIAPDVAVTIASNLAERFGVMPMRTPDPKASAWSDDDDDGGSDDDERKPYEIVDGVAVVPVRGELVNRGSWLDAFSGITSYERLSANLRAAAADSAVRAIVLDMDSPGGEAAGAMEAAAVVREVSKEKRVSAFVNSTAASAAYAIAAGAKEIVVTPSAMVGSIGVVWLHMDYSEALDKAGVKPTLLHAGAYKVDGNQLKPLAPAAAARIQKVIGSYYELFVESVGEHRPALGVDGARETEAGVFVGQAAIEAGLADRIGDFQGLLADLARKTKTAAPAMPKIGARSQSPEDIAMTVKLYKAGESHADSLIEAGKVDKTSSWSFSAEDGDKLLGADGDDWSNYAKFHLGEDDEETDKTKARWKYPHGKDGKVYRSALVAIRQRAGAEQAKDIEDAAGRLLEKIDGKEKEEAALAMETEAARAAGLKEGTTAERARIAAILRSPEADGRLETALTLALDNEMAAEAAVKVLGSVPKVAPAAGTSHSRLDALVPRPDVKPDSGAKEPANDYEKGAAAAAAVLGKAAK